MGDLMKLYSLGNMVEKVGVILEMNNYLYKGVNCYF